jgi:hypothetical protein
MNTDFHYLTLEEATRRERNETSNEGVNLPLSCIYSFMQIKVYAKEVL